MAISRCLRAELGCHDKQCYCGANRERETSDQRAEDRCFLPVWEHTGKKRQALCLLELLSTTECLPNRRTVPFGAALHTYIGDKLYYVHSQQSKTCCGDACHSPKQTACMQYYVPPHGPTRRRQWASCDAAMLKTQLGILPQHNSKQKKKKGPKYNDVLLQMDPD